MHLFDGFGGYAMKKVIFTTENAAFKFSAKEVGDNLDSRITEFGSDKVSQLLELISTDGDETILSSDVDYYFGYVVLDLIDSGRGIVICSGPLWYHYCLTSCFFLVAISLAASIEIARIKINPLTTSRQ